MIFFLWRFPTLLGLFAFATLRFWKCSLLLGGLRHHSETSSCWTLWPYFSIGIETVINHWNFVEACCLVFNTLVFAVLFLGNINFTRRLNGGRNAWHNNMPSSSTLFCKYWYNRVLSRLDHLVSRLVPSVWFGRLRRCTQYWLHLWALAPSRTVVANCSSYFVLGAVINATLWSFLELKWNFARFQLFAQ